METIDRKSCFVDTFTCTFKQEKLDLYFPRFDSFLQQLRSLLQDMTGFKLGDPINSGRSGYSHVHRLLLDVETDKGLKERCMGWVGYGGNNQRESVCVYIDGTGCEHITKDGWNAVHYWLGLLEARITRCDLAVDTLTVSVDDVVDLYDDGRFYGGRGFIPKIGINGDWLNKIEGRTVYVGCREGGKMLRAYEKGKQLGDYSSKWVRLEVEMRSKYRDLPHDMVVNCMQYWAGAYPALKDLQPTVQPIVVPVRKILKFANVIKAVKWARTACGGLLAYLRQYLSDDAIIGLLARVNTVGTKWDDCIDPSEIISSRLQADNLGANDLVYDALVRLSPCASSA